MNFLSKLPKFNFFIVFSIMSQELRGRTQNPENKIRGKRNITPIDCEEIYSEARKFLAIKSSFRKAILLKKANKGYSKKKSGEKLSEEA